MSDRALIKIGSAWLAGVGLCVVCQWDAAIYVWSLGIGIYATSRYFRS